LGGEKEDQKGKGGSSAISRTCSGNFETKIHKIINFIGDTQHNQLYRAGLASERCNLVGNINLKNL